MTASTERVNALEAAPPFPALAPACESARLRDPIRINQIRHLRRRSASEPPRRNTGVARAVSWWLAEALACESPKIGNVRYKERDAAAPVNALI